jgi:hypothetical protein
METRSQAKPVTAETFLAEKEALSAPEDWHGKDISGVGTGVDVRVSSIEGAGMGLFATRDFPKGAYITEYQGAVAARHLIDKIKLSPWHYGYRSAIDVYTHACAIWYLGPVILGLRPKDLYLVRAKCLGGASFCNEGREKRQRNATLRTELLPQRIFLKATRKILAGEEIFCYYGRGYWDRLMTTDMMDEEASKLPPSASGYTKGDKATVVVSQRERKKRKVMRNCNPELLFMFRSTVSANSATLSITKARAERVMGTYANPDGTANDGRLDDMLIDFVFWCVQEFSFFCRFRFLINCSLDVGIK